MQKQSSTTTICPVCGTPFEHYRSRKRQYCGLRCAGFGHRVPHAIRYWTRVDRSGGPGACWPWVGYRDRSGYGIVYRDGGTTKAHRAAWELTNGPITDNLWVLHRCDNPPCVNPAHLFLGTARDNVADMMAKGRAVPRSHLPEHVLRGMAAGRARLTDEQVIAIRKSAVEGYGLRRLGRDYGVSYGTICALVTRRSWQHIP